MTGAGAAAALGYPDYGLITMSEMADNAGHIADTVDVPVIADADTGYGNELNATRTVREYERRGVAGLHIEDQAFPKRCGHLDNKVVISLDEYLAKIKAAVAARRFYGAFALCDGVLAIAAAVKGGPRRRAGGSRLLDCSGSPWAF